MLASTSPGMHPVLFSLDLSGWRLPLLPWLALATVALATAALVGWRVQRPETTLVAGIAAGTSALAAVVLREHVFAPRSLVVTTYGALLALSLVIAWWWTTALLDREGVNRAVVSRAFLAAVLVGIIGARVGYVLTRISPDYSLARALDLRSGGLLGYAGLASGLVALVLVLRGTSASWRQVADAASPSAVLGVAMVSLGGYFSGGAFGRPLTPDSPEWLRTLGTFPRWPEDVLGGAGSPAWVAQVERGLIEVQTPASIPVHPTQLYVVAAALVLLPVVIRARRGRRFHGAAFLAVAFGYGAIRLVVDCWRGDPQRLSLGPEMPAAAFVGGGLVILVLAFMLGPAHAITQARWRQGSWAFALGLALLGATLAYQVDVMKPSLSQWVGLGSAIGAALAWRLYGSTVHELNQ